MSDFTSKRKATKMARRIPTKMWAVTYYDGGPVILRDFNGPAPDGGRIGRVTIVWEPAKKKRRK